MIHLYLCLRKEIICTWIKSVCLMLANLTLEKLEIALLTPCRIVGEGHTLYTFKNGKGGRAVFNSNKEKSPNYDLRYLARPLRLTGTSLQSSVWESCGTCTNEPTASSPEPGTRASIKNPTK